MSTKDGVSELLARHADLEATHGDGDGGSFLSGWQCQNPWIGEIRSAVEREAALLDAEKYFYFDDDPRISDGLIRLHEKFDGSRPQAIVCGAGSSTLIFTFCAWLRANGYLEVFYLPPLYFSLHFALRLFGIRARAVSGRHPYEPDFTVNFPNERRSILIVTDPIWYAGLSLDVQLVAAIKRWQKETSSIVFVDGSFQYSRWYGAKGEATASLDPMLTVRLICATKILAAHGFRFSHVLLPSTLLEEYKQIYSNIFGSASLESIAFGRAAAKIMTRGRVSKNLMQLASSRHAELRRTGTISSELNPSCGYFVFERIFRQLPAQTLLMDGKYFEQKRYAGYFRINLLSPSIGLLD
jgi:aspartate/methionine/tyrosine aminotransferase